MSKSRSKTQLVILVQHSWLLGNHGGFENLVPTFFHKTLPQSAPADCHTQQLNIPAPKCPIYLPALVKSKYRFKIADQRSQFTGLGLRCVIKLLFTTGPSLTFRDSGMVDKKLKSITSLAFFFFLGGGEGECFDYS